MMSSQSPKSSSSKKNTKVKKNPTEKNKSEASRSDKKSIDDNLSSFLDRFSDATSSAFKFAKKTGGTSYKVGKALIQSQDQLKLMINTGQSLKDLREVAGLTATELSEAINLKDKSIIEAAENGTATLSFELILRLSALLARNDPIPFILKYSRTYSPETWRILNDWGVGKLPLHYERERQFINIYRSQDKARELSDEGFSRVLEFTKQAFNLSLHFIGEQEDALQSMLEVQEQQLEALKRKMPKAKSRTRQDQTENLSTKEPNDSGSDMKTKSDTNKK